MNGKHDEIDLYHLSVDCHTTNCEGTNVRRDS